MEEKQSIIGFELGGDQLHLVALEIEGERKTLKTFARVPLPFAFSLGEIHTEVAWEKLRETLRSQMETHQLSGQAAVAIPHSWAFVRKVPVDPSLSPEELRDHILWEGSQFLPETSHSDYLVNFETLPGGEEGVTEVWMAVYRKQLIAALQVLFSGSPVALNFVDLDIFSAQNAIRENYVLGEEEPIGLVDVTSKGLVIHVMAQKRCYLIRNVDFEARREPSVSGENEKESLARFISRELRRISLEYKLGDDIEGFPMVFLYGAPVDPELIGFLADGPAKRFEVAQPFQTFDIDPAIEELYHREGNLSEYLVSVGAALRLVPVGV